MRRKSSEASVANNETTNYSSGLKFDQKWQIIQHFTEWIKHDDSKIQMLLTVEGVIIAGYGAFLPTIFSSSFTEEKTHNIWFIILNLLLIITNFIFAIQVLRTIKFGFFNALQPDTNAGKNDTSNKNIFYYGTYVQEDIPEKLKNGSQATISKDLDSQIAVLGRIATKKFENVIHLQKNVMCSSVILFIVVLFSFLRGI